MLAGSIPIYYGPRLDRAGIPDLVYIRLEDINRDISIYLKEISAEEISKRLSSILKFLKSDDFSQNWLAESIFARVANSIDHFISHQ